MKVSVWNENNKFIPVPKEHWMNQYLTMFLFNLNKFQWKTGPRRLATDGFQKARNLYLATEFDISWYIGLNERLKDVSVGIVIWYLDKNSSFVFWYIFKACNQTFSQRLSLLHCQKSKQTYNLMKYLLRHWYLLWYHH